MPQLHFIVFMYEDEWWHVSPQYLKNLKIFGKKYCLENKYFKIKYGPSEQVDMGF